MTAQELIEDLRAQINPAYAGRPGTESYERRQCVEVLEAMLMESEEEMRRVLLGCIRSP